MNTPSSTRSIRPLRRLLAVAAAAVACSAQAVPVSVSVNGLPPGLAPVLNVQRNVCPDGMGWVNNPSQVLTESSHTVIEQVTLPSGQVTLRSRVVTVYGASFDTPVTPATRTQPWEVRCSAVGIDTDQFRFTLRVPGVDANDLPVSTASSLGTTLQSSTVSFHRTVAAKTTSFTPALSTISRGVPMTVDTTHSASIGSVQGQRLDFLRPSTLFIGAFSRVASLFVRTSDGAACVQAGSTTRCLSGGVAVEAGGVRLRGLQRNISSLPGVTRFQFDLLPSFPIGTLKLSAAADASDLAGYLVDGSSEVLDLLPWQSMTQTLSVQ